MSAASLRHLARLAEAPRRTILGLMSGTSLDGLDLALCDISGAGLETRLTCRAFTTVPYTDDFRQSVLSVFAKRNVDLEHLTLLNREIADVHAGIIRQTLSSWGVEASDVDLLASHGQTIYHAPSSFHGRSGYGNATLQLGDGDHLAQGTGIVTCSDFRQKHIAAGGEGAPLATYGDLLILSAADEARILLNIGGIANFTYLPPTLEPGEATSSDIGPGNTLMDAFVRKHLAPATFDRDGEIARSGQVDAELLTKLKQKPFLQRPFPKTTGPEEFSLAWFEEEAGEITPPDALATLNRLTAETIAEAMARVDPAAPLFVSGGGYRNRFLLETIRELMPNRQIETTTALGIDPDAKEAILFALLANELVAGDPSVFEGRIGRGPAVSLGKISLPN